MFFIPDYIDINGGKKLKEGATVSISGAKNEVLGVMTVAVLTREPVELHNVPFISDVLDMGKIMIDLGIDVKYNSETRVMRLHAVNIKTNILSDEAFKFRASYYIWGALIARFMITKEFDSLSIPVPGGCNFAGGKKSSGRRPIDFHTNLIRNIFNARVFEKDDRIIIKLPKKQPANDSNPIFSTPLLSHGATFHWMLSAATAARTKFFYNASMEPEVGHLLGILNRMGANIRGTNHTAITSFGTGKLLSGGTFHIMPDRMESAAYALLAFALNSEIILDGMDTTSSMPWLNSVKEIAGVSTVQKLGPATDGKYERVKFDFRGREVRGRTFQISPYPGKETDLQQIWAPVLALAKTDSIIIDPQWNRYAHLAEMAKFGLKSEFSQIKIKNATVKSALRIVIHPSVLKPATASGMDIRGTFGVIMSAIIAKGHSRIDNPSYALRGHPNMIRNLQNIGVDVTPSKEGATLPMLPKLI